MPLASSLPCVLAPPGSSGRNTPTTPRDPVKRTLSMSPFSVRAASSCPPESWVIVGFYRRTWEHSDATIDALPLDAPDHVPWWPEPRPNTNLFAVMVHVLGESIRHAGHADVLREGLDGRTGVRAENERPIDEEARAAYRAKIERAARSAAPITA